MINSSRLIRLTQKVIQFNSENPPGNELALSKFIQKDMKSSGLDVRLYTFEKNRPNVVATLKGSAPGAQARRNAVLITPHFDTVTIGKGWTYPPLGGQIHNGRIYGRGATDDKGNLASCLEVMRSLAEDKVRLKRDVIMAATVDEETGSKCGIIPLLNKKILQPKDAVILDSDNFDSIICQKGLFHSRVQIFGKKAHAAYNWRGVNAIEVAMRVIEKIKKHKFKYKPHPLLHPPTTNIGVIRGGDKVNIVADFCEFALDIRFMPSMKSKDVLDQVKKIIRSETQQFKIIIDDLQQPYELEKNHPMVKIYVETARKMKLKTQLKGSNGATVITFFKNHGIPAFATGYGSPGNAHTTDESVEIKNLVNGTKLLEAYLKAFDSKDPLK